MRKKRQYSKNGFYHIVIRGVNKQNIFYDDEDKKLFIKLMRKYAVKYKINIHAFCLMENHVHLEIEDQQKNISAYMQIVCSVYARLFNRKYDRIGHLFQDRYASEIIKDMTAFFSVYRYIMQNPKKAGLGDVNSYEWTSFRLCKRNDFVTRNLIYDKFTNNEKMYEFISKEVIENFLEIELRPSEKKVHDVELVKRILGTSNPIYLEIL